MRQQRTWGKGSGRGTRKVTQQQLARAVRPIIEALEQRQMLSLTNGNFEYPSLTTGTYQSHPTDSGWVFGLAAGITTNQSDITTSQGAAAPEGAQAAYLSAGTQISQSISDAEGRYAVQLQIAKAPGNTVTSPVEVYLDSTLIGSFVAGESYTLVRTDAFDLDGQEHTLSIAAPSGVGNWLLDDARIAPEFAAPVISESGGNISLAWNAYHEYSTYTVERCIDGGAFSAVASGLDDTAWGEGPLAPGATYTYRVICDEYLSGSASAAPSFDIALIDDGGIITASWNAYGSGSYTLERSTDNVNFSPVAQDLGATTFGDSTITRGTHYYYRARTSDGFYSSVLDITPRVFTLTPTNTSGGIRLRWDAYGSTGSYTVWRSTDGVNFVTRAQDLPGDTYTDAGVVEGTRYYYRILDGDGVSSDLAIKTAHSGLVAPTLTDTGGSITIEWDRYGTIGIYTLERSVDSGEFVPLITGLTGTAYTDSVTPGQTYAYRVRTGADLSPATSTSARFFAAPSFGAGDGFVTIVWDSYGSGPYTVQNSGDGINFGTVTTTDQTYFTHNGGGGYYRILSGSFVSAISFVRGFPAAWMEGSTLVLYWPSSVGTLECSLNGEAFSEIGPFYGLARISVSDGNGYDFRVRGDQGEVTLASVNANVFDGPELSNIANGIRLSWEYRGAALYMIERDGQIIGQTTATSWTDTTRVLGQTYSYRIHGRYDDSDSTTILARAQAPIAAISGAGIHLSWDSFGASGSYAVERSSNGAIFAVIQDDISALSYVDGTAAVGSTYWYRITRCALQSEAIQATREAFAAPSLSDLSGGIGLSWPSYGVSGFYTVERALSGGEFIPVGTTSGTSWQDWDVASGIAWSYRVRRGQDISASSMFTMAAMPAPTLSDNAGSVSLAWNSYGQGDFYTVERSFDNVHFRAIGTSSGTAFTDRPTPGVHYYYRITRGQEVSAISSITAGLFWAPAISYNPEGGLDLTWGAFGNRFYTIQRSSDGISFEDRTSTTYQTWTDTSVSPGDTYWYRLLTSDGHNSALTRINYRALGAPPLWEAEGGIAVGLGGSEVGYQIERSSNGINFSWVGDGASDAPYWVDLNIVPNTTYYYRVVIAGQASAASRFNYRQFAIANTPDGVELFWGTFGDASTYDVQRSDDGGENWTTIGDDIAGPEFLDRYPGSAVPGYRVISDTGVVSGISQITVSPYFAAPTLTNTAQGVRLSWTPYGQTPYEVQRLIGYDQEAAQAIWMTVANGLTETSYVDGSVFGGSDYVYRVVTSDGFASGEATIGYQPFYGPSLTASPAGVTITWNAYGSAGSYTIERSDTSHPQFVPIAAGLSTTSYFDSEARALDATYQYRIVSGTDVSQVSAIALHLPEKPQLFNAYGGVYVAFEGYGLDPCRIERSTSASFSTYTELGLGVDGGFVDTTAAVGARYYYRIRTSYGISEVSEPITATHFTLSVADNGGSLTLTWPSYGFGGAYTLLRAVNEEEGFSQVFSGSGHSYTDTAVIPGNLYRYYVATGGSSSAAVQVTPRDLTLSLANAADGVYLNWEHFGPTRHYAIERSTSPSGGFVTRASDLTATSFTDIDVSLGTTYYYRLSTTGAEASGNITRRNFLAPGLTDDKPAVILSWQPYGSSGQYFIERAQGAGAFTPIGSTSGTDYRDSGTSPGTTYTYRIRRGTDLSESSTITPEGFAGPWVYDAGEGGIGISWGRYGSDYYTVLREDGATVYQGNETSCFDSSIGPNSTYRYRITTSDGFTSDWGSIDYRIFGAPNVYEDGDSGLFVSWNAYAGGSYIVERSVNGSGFWYRTATWDTWFRDYDISENNTYAYRIIADGYMSRTAEFGFHLLPTDVTGAIATPSTTAAEITVTWDSQTSNTDGFRILRKGGGSDQWTTIAIVGADQTSYRDTSLRHDAQYTYRVRAFNRSGVSQPAQTLPVRTIAAPTPVGTAPELEWVTVSRRTAAALYLNWSTTSTNVSYYIVTRSGGGVGTKTFTRTSPNLADTGLTPGTSYSYSVTAYDASGAASNMQSCSDSTLANLNKPALTAEISGGNVALSWDIVAGATGYDVMQDGHRVGGVSTGTATSFMVASPTPGRHEYTIVAFAEISASAFTFSDTSNPVIKDIADPRSTCLNADSAPEQYIPQEWRDYFYGELTHGLRSRYAMLPATSSIAQPPSAQFWYDPGEWVLNPTNNPATASWVVSTQGSYYDLNGDGIWTRGEPAWMDNDSEAGFNSNQDEPISGTGYVGAIPEGLTDISLSRCGGFLYGDFDRDGQSEPYVPEHTLHLIHGVDGDLYAFGDPITRRLAVWKDNGDGVWGANDTAISDSAGWLTSANAQSGIIQGHRWVRFADKQGGNAGQWDPGELIWLEPPSDSSSQAFRSEVASFYSAVASIAPFFQNGAGATTTWDVPSLIRESGGMHFSGTGTVTESRTGQLKLIGQNTRFLSEVQPGDWITANSHQYHVATVGNDSELLFDAFVKSDQLTSAASFEIDNWRRLTSTVLGLSATRGILSSSSLLVRENLDDLQSALNHLTQLPQIYNIARYDSSSSSVFLDTAKAAVDLYISFWGDSNLEVKQFALGLEAGAASPGALRRLSQINMLRSLIDAVSGVYVHDGSTANNGWSVATSESIVPLSFNDLSKREQFLTTNAGQWANIEPAKISLATLYGPFDWGDGEIEDDPQLDEAFNYAHAISENGLWIATDFSSSVDYGEATRWEYFEPADTLPGQYATWDDPGNNPEPLGIDGPGAIGVCNRGIEVGEDHWSHAAIEFRSFTLNVSSPPADRGVGGDFTDMSLGPRDFNPDRMVWGDEFAVQSLDALAIAAELGTVPTPDHTANQLYLVSDRRINYLNLHSVVQLSQWPTNEGDPWPNPDQYDGQIGYFEPTGLYGRVEQLDWLQQSSVNVEQTEAATVAGPPNGVLPVSSEMDFRNVVIDTDFDDIVEVDQDLTSFGAATGTMGFKANRDLPQVFLPLYTDQYGRVPVHEYLVQGGFSASDNQPLGSHVLDTVFSPDQGQPYAYSLDTRVRRNLLIKDNNNHIKRLEVIRPRGNSVVFEFAWDEAAGQFKTIGTPLSVGREKSRLYVLREDIDANTGATAGYHLLFASGVIHHFNELGNLIAVEDSAGNRVDVTVSGSGHAGRVLPTLSAMDGQGSAQSPQYSVKLNWKNGRIDRVEYAVKEGQDYSGKITTALNYDGPQGTIDKLTKTDDTNAAVPEFSFTYDNAAGTITSGGTTWQRSGSVASGVTITRYNGASAGCDTLEVTTEFNSNQLPTEVTQVLTTPSAQTSATTRYEYQEAGLGDRYANGAPKWGKIASVSYPDQSWEVFFYEQTSGWLRKRITPFKNSAKPSDESSDNAHRVQLYSYFDPSSQSAESSTPQKSYFLTQRPNRVIEKTLGEETGRSYFRYIGDTTISRQATTPGATWTNSASLETITRYAGSGDVLPDTYAPTGITTQALNFKSATGGYEVVTTTSGPNNTAVQTRTSVFNAFGSLISDKTEDGAVVIAEYSGTATASFGRASVIRNALTGQSTSYEDYTWFGPQKITGEDGIITNLTYKPWGRIATASSLNISTAYEYDAAGNAVQSTISSGGMSLVYRSAYDVRGREVYSVGPDDKPVSTAYNDSPEEISATRTFNDGAQEKTIWNRDGSLKEISGSAVYKTTYDSGADGNGLWTQVTSAGGLNYEKTWFNMLGQAYRTQRPGPNSNSTMTALTQFDGLQRPALLDDYTGTITLTQYDESRGYASDAITDMNANAIYDGGIDRNTSYQLSYDYNGGGKPSERVEKSIIHGGGTGATFTPDSVFETRTSVDGFVTTDKAYGLTSTTTWQPGAGQGNGASTTLHADGTQTISTFTNGRLQNVSTYGTSGTNSAAITSITYGYDGLGRLRTTTTPFGTSTLTSSVDYDSATGQVVALNLPGGRSYLIPTSSDARWGRDGSPLQIQRPDGKVTTISRNSQGDVTGIWGAGVYAQQVGYNNEGFNTTLTTFKSGSIGGAGAATTTFTPNLYTGQLQSKSYAQSAGFSSTFADNGQIASTSYGGATLNPQFNSANETSSWTLGSDMSGSGLIRDIKGRLLGGSYASGIDSGDNALTVSPQVSYDAQDRLASEEIGLAADVRVVYDYYGADDMSGLGSPGAIKSMSVMRKDQVLYSVSYEYDPQTKRLATIRAGGNSFAYGYLANTDLVETVRTNYNVLTSTTGFDGSGRMNGLTQKDRDNHTVYGVNYGFNANDQRNQATVTISQVGDNASDDVFEWNYGYDADNADQLTSAYTAGRPDQDVSFSYEFDGIGNRIDKAYNANLDNQYTSNPDADGATMLYDGRGNLVYDGFFTYTYDSANQLTSATPQSTTAGQQKMEAGYDSQGRRIWKKSYSWDEQANGGSGDWTLTSTRKFVYDGWNLVAEFVAGADGLEKLDRSYAWSPFAPGGVGGLLSITTYAADGSASATYIPLFDGNGNVMGLADGASGQLVARYEYDPFGNMILRQGDEAALAANPFGFSTKYLDSETALYYYGYRYYSPQFGRWMTRDPAGEAGGENLYAFNWNDPIDNIDPQGLTAREREMWTGMREMIQGWISPGDPNNEVNRHKIALLDELIKYNGWQEYDWSNEGPTKQQKWNWKKEQALRDELRGYGLNVDIATGFHVMGREIQGNDSAESWGRVAGIQHVDVYYNGVIVRVGLGGAALHPIDVVKNRQYWLASDYKDYPLQRLAVTETQPYYLEAGAAKGVRVDKATDAQILDAVKSYPSPRTGSGFLNNCQNDVRNAIYGGGLYGYEPSMLNMAPGMYVSRNWQKLQEYAFQEGSRFHE